MFQKWNLKREKLLRGNFLGGELNSGFAGRVNLDWYIVSTGTLKKTPEELLSTALLSQAFSYFYYYYAQVLQTLL